jgi:hypothetical protein
MVEYVAQHFRQTSREATDRVYSPAAFCGRLFNATALRLYLRFRRLKCISQKPTYKLHPPGSSPKTVLFSLISILGFEIKNIDNIYKLNIEKLRVHYIMQCSTAIHKTAHSRASRSEKIRINAYVKNSLNLRTLCKLSCELSFKTKYNLGYTYRRMKV